MTVRRGDRFVHRRHLNPDRTPATCVVTAVRRGVVYYRDEPDGMLWKADLDAHEHPIRGLRPGFEAASVVRWLPRKDTP